MGRTTVEPVPEDKRLQYKYWRGASLAKVAMNFARGMNSLNAGNDCVVHFADFYEFALNTAKDTKRLTQLTDSDRLELSKATGHDPESPLPSIVFALESDRSSYLPPSTHGAGHGFVYPGNLNLAAIDPFSRAFIEETIIE